MLHLSRLSWACRAVASAINWLPLAGTLSAPLKPLRPESNAVQRFRDRQIVTLPLQNRPFCCAEETCRARHRRRAHKSYKNLAGNVMVIGMGSAQCRMWL